MSLSKQILFGLIIGGLMLGAMYLFPDSKRLIKTVGMGVAGGLIAKFCMK